MTLVNTGESSAILLLFSSQSMPNQQTGLTVPLPETPTHRPQQIHLLQRIYLLQILSDRILKCVVLIARTKGLSVPPIRSSTLLNRRKEGEGLMKPDRNLEVMEERHQEAMQSLSESLRTPLQVEHLEVPQCGRV